ncbi:lysoplasmalogenase family protein [Polaromonas sp. P1-6]|nr:lysoplasmalogenase family protein [Polaromonas sp. P1-6]
MFGAGCARKGTGRNTYQLDDAINSISLGALSQLSAVLLPLLSIGIYTAVQSSVSLVPAAQAEAFWNTWYGWLLALVFYDFCYYWLHRMGHESAVLWAAHVVHHQSQRYNLSTALRQPSTDLLLGWVFYLPLAVAGVPPVLFGIIALVDLLYQFWVHTEHIGKLGWFDRVFCSPSNHRVHHAVNDDYLDKNYGGILILWDRLFGSFKEETAPCVYGTRSPLDSWDPLWANAEVYWSRLKDSWHANSWADKVRIWFKPPGWRPADVAARFPRPAFDISQVQTFQPAASRAVLWFAAVQFMLLLPCVSAFLWFADSLPPAHLAVWLAALATGFWAMGAVLQGRLSLLEVLLVEAAALGAATGALELLEWHRLFKPLPMILAIILIANRTHSSGAKGRFDVYLLLALAASLAGDVFLMFEGYFIPGLVSFLVAHLFYIALFKQGVAWLPSRPALVTTMGIGAVMYAFLWSTGLPAELRAPVAVYVTAIALMAAQALGRALVLHDQAATRVAMGACVFMLSDALLAFNQFVQPLPMAALWVLSTYYFAQILMVRYMRPPGGEVRSGTSSGHEQV